MQDPYNQAQTAAGLKPLFVADPASKILIIGQAPGLKAQQAGRVFTDLSGEKLRAWLNVSDKEFYNPKNFAVLPMDFYYPGKGKTGDKPPRKEFAGLFHPLIIEQMKQIELTILIGTYAQKYYLGSKMKQNLTETVRFYQDYLPQYFPLVHPSPLNFRWLSKNPWFETEVMVDLQQRISAIIENKD